MMNIKKTRINYNSNNNNNNDNNHNMESTTSFKTYALHKEIVVEGDEDTGDCSNDVFKHYRSSDLLVNKRRAEFSPDTPRKRMSTSTNDISDDIEIVQQTKRKIPTVLNLSVNYSSDVQVSSTMTLSSTTATTPSGILLEAPSIREMSISDDASLHSSELTRSYRKPFLNDRSPTTPMIRRRDDSPVGSFRKKMKVGRGGSPKLTLSRACSVKATPQYLRVNSEDVTGSLSNHHTTQFRERTYSGFFDRNQATSSTSLMPPVATPSSLRRHGSMKIISSKMNKVKRCYSTASAIKRKERVAVGRKPSNALQKRPRRCSEPFLADPLALQNKLTRKQSVISRSLGRRRVSTNSALPTSSKQKLQALAKDELLASLNVPLTNLTKQTSVTSQEEVPVHDVTPHDEHNEVEDVEVKKQAERERRETKRLLIIEEILETEKNYISCLETLNAVFRTQLEGTHIITDKDLNSLFPPHLHNIKDAHMLFMTELEERMNNNDYRDIIGDIFAKMTSASVNLLEIYTAYVNAFPKSISTLSKCTRSSNKFRKFLEDCYENPVVERLDLPSFLLSPVQRLPRYILLLRELLKYTDDEHPDKYFISEAMREMELLISSLNSSIHNSMEFYSASDSRRKKMSRQLTNKKRKHRPSSTILRNSKKTTTIHENNKSDNDQGYCSLGERKDESPEDDTPTRNKQQRATWRGKRSMSMVSASSEEGGKPNTVARRKNDLSVASRNSDSRKSWRRSIGAVFSNLWSNKDDDEHHTPNRKVSKHSLSLDHSDTRDVHITEVDEDDLANTTHNTTPINDSINVSEGTISSPSRKSSNAKRKVAIMHQAPSIDEHSLPTTIEVLDGNENIKKINTLVENTSIEDVTDGGSGNVSILSAIETDNNCSMTDDEDVCRNSSESVEQSSIPPSLKIPSSPQLFLRGGKLRGSAGPVFKSLFQRNSTNKMQKTLSMDALNVKSDHHHEEKKNRHSMSLKKQRSKEYLHKTQSATQAQPAVEHPFVEQSLSSPAISGDSNSASSTETISSKSSQHSNHRAEDGDSFNNDTSAQHGRQKEKKNKLLKTFKSLVSKK